MICTYKVRSKPNQMEFISYLWYETSRNTAVLGVLLLLVTLEGMPVHCILSVSMDTTNQSRVLFFFVKELNIITWPNLEPRLRVQRASYDTLPLLLRR